MAYLPNYDDEEQQGQNGVPLANTGATGASAPKGAGAIGYGNQPNTAVPSAPGTSQGQGSFVDFSKYAAANPESATNTANQMAGQVGSQAAGAQGMIKGLEGQFYADATAGSPFGDPYRAQQAPTTSASAPGRGLSWSRQGIANGDQNQGSGAFQNDNPLAGPNANNPDWAAYLGGLGYTGPNDLTSQRGYSETLSNTQKAGQSLDALGTTSGQQALLQQTYGGQPGYGAGSSGFDAGLAGSAGGSKFQALRSQYGDLGQALDAANSRASERADQLKQFDTQQAQTAAAMVPNLQKYWGQNLGDDQRGNPLTPTYSGPTDASHGSIPAGTDQATVDAYQTFLQNGGNQAGIDFNKWVAAGMPYQTGQDHTYYTPQPKRTSLG